MRRRSIPSALLALAALAATLVGACSSHSEPGVRLLGDMPSYETTETGRQSMAVGDDLGASVFSHNRAVAARKAAAASTAIAGVNENAGN